jgi:hypothetical protein
MHHPTHRPLIMLGMVFVLACDPSSPEATHTSVGMMDAGDDMPTLDMSVRDQDMLTQDLATGVDTTPDLEPDTTPDIPTMIAWRTAPPAEFMAMKPIMASIQLTPAPSQPLSVQWTITSRTAQGVDCSSLINSQSASEVVLLLSGDADPRCADELELSASLEDGATLTAPLSVVPNATRVLDFVEAADNPQPPIQTCPEWECLNHSDPTLGRLPDGQLAVWFAAGGDRVEGFPVVGRAVGEVDGTWQLDGAPVMEPADGTPESWDRGRETPSVRWRPEADAWDMWYLGYNVGYHVDPAIGQSRSLNAEGTQWSRPDAPIYRPSEGAWDETFLTSPGAMLGSDGVWRLYFAGASTKIDAIGRIGVLTSTDGSTWTPHQDNPVFEGAAGDWDANILDPHVQFIGGRYVMWYSALAGQFVNDPPISIGVATSEDGFTWTRLQADPIITPESKTWTSARVLDVEVLAQPDGSLLMVGYAISNTPPNPAFPDFKPGRIGFWRAALP